MIVQFHILIALNLSPAKSLFGGIKSFTHISACRTVLSCSTGLYDVKNVHSSKENPFSFPGFVHFCP